MGPLTSLQAHICALCLLTHLLAHIRPASLELFSHGVRLHHPLLSPRDARHSTRQREELALSLTYKFCKYCTTRRMYIKIINKYIQDLPINI